MRTLDKVWRRVEEALKKGKYIDEADIEYLLENQQFFTEEQRATFERNLPVINKQTEMQKNNKALAKQSMWQRNPILKRIYGFFHKEKKSAKTGKEQNYNKVNKINLAKRDSERQPDKITDAMQKENAGKTDLGLSKPKKEIFVISDLHGRIDNWDFVKVKLVAEPESTAIILGDAMDREAFGPEILMEIKDLSDKGRVAYIPGNHDMFMYNWLAAPAGKQKELARMSLEKNGGKVTMQKMSNYNQIMEQELKSGRISRPIQLNELVTWLGNQPIQRVVKENGKLFALAHAIFSTKLYNQDPNFNLKKALNLKLQGKDIDTQKEFDNVMWWREGKHEFTNLSNPRDAIMVAGHTSQNEINQNYVKRKPIFSYNIYRLWKRNF